MLGGNLLFGNTPGLSTMAINNNIDFGTIYRLGQVLQAEH
jgi:hypothetical protein